MSLFAWLKVMPNVGKEFLTILKINEGKKKKIGRLIDHFFV